MIEMYAIVTGKVQGVAYRTYIQDAAGELKVSGYTRNLPDGTVEVIAQGDPLTLKDFVEFLNEGSLLSSVEGVAVEWRSAVRSYDDFSIRH